jgi:hypothetical protein
LAQFAQQTAVPAEQHLAIGYRLQFGNEWDYRIQYSAGGGTTTGMFTGQYIEYTGDTTMLISLQAM